MAQSGAQERGDLVPSSPQALLKALPEILPRWELTRSEARSYVARGFFAQAIREYTEILPPEVAEKTRTPIKVVMEIRDTCENENQLRPFRMTDEQLLAANLKKSRWRENPAIKVDDGNVERESIRILLRGRWILQVVYSGREFQVAERWLEQVDLADVNDLNYVRYPSDPAAVPIVRVDELDPSRNQRYLVSVTTDSNLNALTKRIETEYREFGWELEKSEPPPKPLRDSS